MAVATFGGKRTIANRRRPGYPFLGVARTACDSRVGAFERIPCVPVVVEGQIAPDGIDRMTATAIGYLTGLIELFHVQVLVAILAMISHTAPANRGDGLLVSSVAAATSRVDMGSLEYRPGCGVIEFDLPPTGQGVATLTTILALEAV